MSDQQSSQPLHIRKYPNRRYYDTTRSQHVTLRNLYELVREGHPVTVTDSRTGEDITNAILVQVLLVRAPSKLELLPSAFVHQFLRADGHDLRCLVDQLFKPTPRPGNSGPRAQATGLDPTGSRIAGPFGAAPNPEGGPELPTAEA